MSLAGVAAFAVAVTVLLTWPQALHPLKVADHFDPYFSIWRLGHVAHALSRWPIESLGEIDLSMRWSEPRKAIIGAIRAPGARVIVIAAHLGLLPFERRKQFARLRRRIETIAERPLIVLGDFNDFPRLNERALAGSLAVTPRCATTRQF